MNFLSPEEIIKKANIDEGMKVADFGCGSGFYSLATAKIVGARGKVYALDIQKEPLGVLRGKARDENISNIETIWADLETEHGSHLKDGLVDRVIISNILFQVENKENLIKEALRILKPRGIAVVIEQDRLSTAASSTLSGMLLNKEKVKALFESPGFKTEKEFEAGAHHYGVLFRKS